ncbi:hypothetical protein H5S40_08940 [Limosilactobacillus sp. RRLNB_1_1]|uniref:dUTPase n=1 Tax=Limosilactobacillus albertensis TaxID=2759752 RepID=A0A7W3TSX9_9LACO|nr:hypothetical protein [Limosilactobacillus albertensis]MBB1070275.1 hypothetical protein [Limosilactobacillus albertensis]MCD7119126.1 hypothetical protein [Limosilactobacillus albertensis]MCD7129334.1 hypothetical protein [Limosilactobacillus albertensis]
MLDITKMLHQIIDLELKIDDEKELLIGPEVRKQTIFLDLDISLSDMAEAAGWYKVINPNEADKKKLLKAYAEVMGLFLLFSAKMQWTHLVVLDEEAWRRITDAKRATKLADLNKSYLAIKHFLSDAYFNHQQESYRHAWHLLLKMGIVDWKLTPEQITKAYQAMIDQY